MAPGGRPCRKSPGAALDRKTLVDLRNVLIFAAAGFLLAVLVPRMADNVVPPAPAAATREAPSRPARPAYTREPVVMSARSRTVSITPARNGHFLAEGRIEGRPIRFVVDTGASTIALTKQDAARLGVQPFPNDYTAQVRTANGTVRAAPVTLREVEIGDISVRDVRALVLPEAALSENLLGLSFLSRLRRFEFREGRLVLEQ